MTPRIRNELRCIALLALAFLIIFHREIFLGQTLIGDDIIFQNYPRMMFLRDSLMNGEVPLWSPYIYGGYPLAAEGQTGVFYPLNLALLFLSPAWIPNAIIFMHLFLAAVFTYLLCRTIKIGYAGAMIAGLAYSLNTLNLVHLQHFNIIIGMAWIPLMLALIEIWLKKSGRAAAKTACALGIVTAVLFLGAHPQIFVYGMIAAAIFAAFRMRCHQVSPRGMLTAALISGAVALLLSAIQLLPLIELVRLSIRAGKPLFESVFSGSFQPKFFIAWIFPHFFGAPWNATYHGGGSATEALGGVSFFALVLAGTSLFFRNTRARSAPFLALAFLGLIMGLGDNLPTARLFYHIPVLSAFRAPSRALILWCLGAAVAAGAALDFLIKNRDTLKSRKTLAYLFFLTACAAAAGFIALCLFHSPIKSFLLAHLSPGAPHSAAFYERKTTLLLGMMRHDALMAAVALWLTHGLLSTGARWGRFARALPAVALVFACIDSFGIVTHFANRTGRGVLLYEPPVVSHLSGESGGSRLYAAPPIDHLRANSPRNAIFTGSDFWKTKLKTMDFELTMLYRVPGINGYGTLLVRDFAALTHIRKYIPQSRPLVKRESEKLSMSYNAGKLDPVRDRDLLRMLKVRRMIRPAPGNPARLELLDLAPDQAPASPLWLVCRGARVNPPRDVGFDPVSPPEDSGCRPRPVAIDRPAAGRIRVKTSMCCAGELVLMEKYYPGWRVTERMPGGSIQKRDHYERFTGIGVRLPAGLHELEYVFAPRSAHIGLAMGLLGLALSFVLVFVGKTKGK